MSETFDVIVVGGGPGGYPAAIRAGQLGFKTLCIDAWVNRDNTPAFGGTCLNAGCVPSKALLESSELVHRAQHEFANHGINVGEVKFDLAKMQARKTTVSKALTGGIKALFAAAKVTGLAGTGKLLGGGKVEYTSLDGKTVETYTGKHIVIATGSEPVNLKIAPFDGDRIVDSWGALDFTEVPQRLGVIGAGVIGVELGSVWNRLGAKTVIIEALPTFLPMVDAAISKEALRHLTKQGLDIRLGAKVASAKAGKKGVTVEYEQDGQKKTEEFDKLIVAVGRKPYTKGLGIDAVGVQLDERGFVKVDAHYKTNVEGIYAVGDVIGGAMLAHKAIEEGVALSAAKLRAYGLYASCGDAVRARGGGLYSVVLREAPSGAGILLGQGKTWEEAFADTERRGAPGLVAEIAELRKSEHRLLVQIKEAVDRLRAGRSTDFALSPLLCALMPHAGHAAASEPTAWPTRVSSSPSFSISRRKPKSRQLARRCKR